MYLPIVQIVLSLAGSLVGLPLAAPNGGVALLAAATQTNSPAAQRYENAYWFDGERFVAGSRCVGGEVFVDCPVDGDKAVFDLDGGYVVPPFGDAHTHNFSNQPSAIFDQYIDDGVFYVQVLNNYSSTVEAMRTLVAEEGSIDVAFANGGLSSTGSHPHLLYEALALNAYTAQQRKDRAEEIREGRSGDRDAYWRLDTDEAFEQEQPNGVRPR